MKKLSMEQAQQWVHDLFAHCEPIASDPFYVPVYQADRDPIIKLRTSIELKKQHGFSRHLLTGQRKCGKTTQLKGFKKPIRGDKLLCGYP